MRRRSTGLSGSEQMVMLMQETRISKVSRRFYIDHADDHAVIRSVPVAVEVAIRPQQVHPVPTDATVSQEMSHERKLSKLMHSAARVPRPRSLRRRG
ncbi:MAG: hypothetical protein WKF81_10140 [Thermomicrobiales bacterium]